MSYKLCFEFFEYNHFNKTAVCVSKITNNKDKGKTGKKTTA